MLREIIDYLESVEFDVECGLASGITTLHRFLEETPKVQQLTDLCKERAIAVFILGHMLDITLRKYDIKYRNPHEMGFLAYLHCVTKGHPDLKGPAIVCTKLLKGCYWPQRYVEQYLQ